MKECNDRKGKEETRKRRDYLKVKRDYRKRRGKDSKRNQKRKNGQEILVTHEGEQREKWN